MKTIRNPWGTLERCWCSGWCTATHVDPSLWNHWGGFFFFQTSRTKQKQNSAGSSFKLCSGSYSLRMMSTARGGLSRQLGSIVKLDWLFMLAAGGLSFPPPNKRCSTPASVPLQSRWCSPSRNFARTGLTDGASASRIPAGQQTALLSSLQHSPQNTCFNPPTPRTRLGPAVIGRAGSPANHSLDVRVTA